jgi:hypothetical protein
MKMTGRLLRGLSVLLLGALASACTSAGSTPTAPPTVSPATRTPTPDLHHHHLPRPQVTHSPAAPAAFRWRVAPVARRDLGASWHPGCPVGPASLRAITMTFWGFDGRPHQGVLVGAATAVPAYVSAFRAMYAARFPIRRLQPVADYGGSDNRSMRHDNTSAFNCRYAVADGPKTWSMHAYGLAVDIDPRENPYELDGKVLPPAGKPYVNRSDVRPGMVVSGSTPVAAFAAVGWGWGGSWPSSPDFQHFSSTGQ